MKTFIQDGKTIHDYREKHLRWGWNILKITWNVLSQKKKGYYNPGDKFEVQGIGRGIKTGDQILIEFKVGILCFDIEEITYSSNPPDLWKAKLVFVGEVDMEGE